MSATHLAVPYMIEPRHASYYGSERAWWFMHLRQAIELGWFRNGGVGPIPCSTVLV